MLWSLDLKEFDLNLQVQPGDVCSQVGLCSAKRVQSKRLGGSLLDEPFIYQSLVLISAFIVCIVQLGNNLKVLDGCLSLKDYKVRSISSMHKQIR